MLTSSAHKIEPISKFHLSDEDFAQLIGAYKLKFEEQLKFNQEFEIENDKPQDETAESLNIFLREKLNKAFKDSGKLLKYNQKISAEVSSTDRGIHDGFHVASVALYAKKFLAIYQDNKELFSPEIQKEIAEFDDPKKIRDLEILCLMHDVARVNKDHDQAEYKNAFYVALMLREMGDERFEGDEISEEGLKMIMDLASKESKNKDKSLMSKLIQSSDSLAILRDPHFRSGSTSYNFELNDVFKDFSKIHFDYASQRNRMQKSIRELVAKISLVEKNPNILLENLECQQNPQEVFLKHDKTLLLMSSFDESLKLLKTDDAVEALPRHILSDMFYVHVVGVRSPFGLDKQGQVFRCATSLCSGTIIRSYADRSWLNNPVFILNSERDSGVVYVAGFKTDVGSDMLIGKTFSSNIEASHFVQMQERENNGLYRSYLDNIIYSEEEMYKKIQEMDRRRKDPKVDISDKKYNLIDKNGVIITGKVGKNRYGSDYSAPHHEVRTSSGELRHNEIHILNSVHIVHFVGMARDVFEHTPAHKGGQLSDFSHFGLLRLKFYKDQINFEKKRLLSLEKPMEDERFKNCVEFELSRVTNLFEKIAHLKKLTQELENNPNNDHPLIEKSVKKKILKKTEHKGYKFEDTPENRATIKDKKIHKFNLILEELYKNLEEFEKPKGYGFTGLKDKVDEICQEDDLSSEIKKWKDDILIYEEGNKALSFAISKVKSGLEKTTQMALYDVFNPQEIIILSDEEYQKKFVKTPELFRELCERKDYSSILLLFTKKEINKLSEEGAGSKLRDGSELPNYLTIFLETLRKNTSNNLGLLIKMGLDIYSLPDKSDNQEYQLYCGASCLPNSHSGKIIYFTVPFKLPESILIYKTKSKDPLIFEKLIKFGAIFSKDPITSFLDDEEYKIKQFNDFLKDYSFKSNSNFRDNLLANLRRYSSEIDLSALESKLEFLYRLNNFKPAKGEVTLNGYGLLKMFENYPNLTKDDNEMSALVNKLKILRGDREPEKAVASAQQSSLVFSPLLTNTMA